MTVICKKRKLLVNPIALRMAKTLLSFGHSECNRVKEGCNGIFFSFSRNLLGDRLILHHLSPSEFWSLFYLIYSGELKLKSSLEHLSLFTFYLFYSSLIQSIPTWQSYIHLKLDSLSTAYCLFRLITK